MKKLLFFLLILLAVLFWNKDLFPQSVTVPTKQLNEKQISENLLIGIQSGNKGLCASSTYLLGELCCKQSVIPLLRLLHNSEFDEIRILAALSLCKIGDARGIFAVKRSAVFDESERVKRLCGLFYRAVLVEKV
jgi:hypothetical protein